MYFDHHIRGIEQRRGEIRDPQLEQNRIKRCLGLAPIIKLSENTALIYTAKWIELENSGQQIGVHDLWNAALAIELDIPLHGCDRHFKRISGLKYVHVP